MDKPNEGDPLTTEEVNQALNVAHFPGFQIDKNWHVGLFEPWTIAFGYPQGMAIYGGIKFAGEPYHVYFLNDGHQLPIILGRGQKPEDYGFSPET